MRCETSQGTGDVDLYLRFEGSDDPYDCYGGISFNDEWCTSTATANGTLIVVLEAFDDFSNVNLACICSICGDGACNGGESCYSCPTDCGECDFVGSCPEGFNETELSADSGSSATFNMEVSAGDIVKCVTSPSSSGTSGDSNLSLLFGESLGPDCTSSSPTNNEECQATAAADDVLVIEVNANTSFTGVDLVCTYSFCTHGKLPTIPPAVCGDGYCEWYTYEYCDTCPTDCGTCTRVGSCPGGFTLNGLAADPDERLYFSMDMFAGETAHCTTFSPDTTSDADLVSAGVLVNSGRTSSTLVLKGLHFLLLQLINLFSFEHLSRNL